MKRVVNAESGEHAVVDQERGDAVELMELDHHEILAMFDAYAALVQGRADPAARKALADDICMAITIHMRLENEMLYPLALQGCADGGGLNEAEADHAATREQIALVLGMKPEHADYDGRVLALGQALRLHVADERKHLFPAVRVSGADLQRLAGRVRERRVELVTVSDALREFAMLPVKGSAQQSFA